MELHLVNRKLSQIGEWIALWGGCIFVFVMIFLCYAAAVFEACPANGHDCDTVFWLGNFCVGQILLSLALFQYFSRFNCVSHWQRQSCVADLCRHINELEEEHSEKVFGDRGKYCIDCNREAPLRSHHCPLCKICVLRKDHHCFVTGKCVGLGNQRFFMTFLFWCVLGLSYCLYELTLYISSINDDLLPFGFVKLIGPFAIARWMLSYTSLFDAAMCSLYTFAWASLVAAGGFLGLQIYYTCYGYTMYEYHSVTMREAFDGDGVSISERFRLVFGKNYLLNFFFPMFWEKPLLTPEIANNLFRVRSKLL
ncbi:unnamed protein product [Auanema sp. JU1783]|nr:unnamed protein product [Auanema sp. JU1783]